MVHDGVIRRSEEEFSDVIWRGISPAACMLMLMGGGSRELDLIWNGRSLDKWVLRICCSAAVLDVCPDSTIDF
jgi:hypothetical protein